MKRLACAAAANGVRDFRAMRRSEGARGRSAQPRKRRRIEDWCAAAATATQAATRSEGEGAPRRVEGGEAAATLIWPAAAGRGIAFTSNNCASVGLSLSSDTLATACILVCARYQGEKWQALASVVLLEVQRRESLCQWEKSAVRWGGKDEVTARLMPASLSALLSPCPAALAWPACA